MKSAINIPSFITGFFLALIRVFVYFNVSTDGASELCHTLSQYLCLGFCQTQVKSLMDTNSVGNLMVFDGDLNCCVVFSMRVGNCLRLTVQYRMGNNVFLSCCETLRQPYCKRYISSKTRSELWRELWSDYCYVIKYGHRRRPLHNCTRSMKE